MSTVGGRSVQQRYLVLDKEKRLAYAIDNQKFFYVSELLGDPKKDITASYAPE